MLSRKKYISPKYNNISDEEFIKKVKNFYNLK
jgi:hypothetical protein